ncbi:MAG: hypothetical protein AAF039_12790 [Bacteroidota bacterium]
MSTIKITFQTQALDFSPLIRGRVSIMFNDGDQDHDLFETHTTGVATSTRFKEESWDGTSETDNLQAANFANAFNRDYSQIGGSGNIIQLGNLFASVNDNEVTITAENGTFISGSSYNGNVLVVGGFIIDNPPTVANPKLTFQRSANVGDCDNIQYSASATDGTPPFALRSSVGTIIEGWDGASIDFDLPRGTIQTIRLTDSNLVEVARTENVPRKLVIGEFQESIAAYDGFSDIIIQSLNPVFGTTPLEYTLEPQGSLNGVSYQSGNTFPGVLQGSFYELFVRDVYGCEITKTIEVRAFQDSTVNENPLYFDVMSANSIIHSPCPAFNKDTKKNFHNTGSWNELSGIRNEITQIFDPSDVRGTQFKSSFPYHVITLHNCDGTKVDIPPILISENLGAKEKVDCRVFPLNGKTAVYFDGGNAYEPDTTTVIGASEYLQFTPPWAIENQIVFIDGYGGLTIESTGYDQDRAKGYFVVDAITASESDAIVQVTFNKQDYNTFEYYLDMSKVSGTGRVVIEKGNSFNEIIGDPWVSELVKIEGDSEDLLKIEWSDSKNKGDIVFQSNIKFEKRIEGRFRPKWDGESETFAGDSREFSLRQTTYQNYRLELDRLSAKEVNQLNIASGLESFIVNNVPLVRQAYPEIEPLGDSNYYTWTCELGYGGDGLAIQSDEIVLDVSTGVEGGGGTGSDNLGTVLYDGRTRLNISGGFVTVDGKFIVID